MHFPTIHIQEVYSFRRAVVMGWVRLPEVGLLVRGLPSTRIAVAAVVRAGLEGGRVSTAAGWERTIDRLRPDPERHRERSRPCGDHSSGGGGDTASKSGCLQRPEGSIGRVSYRCPRPPPESAAAVGGDSPDQPSTSRILNGTCNTPTSEDSSLATSLAASLLSPSKRCLA